MKPYLITFLFTLSFFTSVTTTTHRRILHQPLFPVSSTPPPPPPSPPDNPFFHENTPNQPQSPPPPPPDTAAAAAGNNTAAPPPDKKSGKKTAVVISVVIVTLGMMSALAFVIYKHKSKQKSESRKLVGGNNEDSPRSLKTSSFLYVGAVEPSITATESTNGSPYDKLNSVKRSDRYRPSPDLHPLPPLSMPPHPAAAAAASMAFSDDDEEGIRDFYTPHGSIASTDEGFHLRSLNTKRIPRRISSPNPNSKRTSPKSRLSVSSSPETTSEKPPPPPPSASPENPGDFPIKTRSSSSKQQLPKSNPISPSAKVIPKIVKSRSSQHLSNDDLQSHEVLDPKKSQNIATLLRALHVTQDEVYEALVEGNPNSLGAELLETLVKMAPTKEEEMKIKDYRGDVSKLGFAERFLKVILDIPYAFKRVEALLYRVNFENEVKYLRSCFQTLEAASEELKNCQLFLKLLEAILQTGNRMNVDTNHGEATAFKLDTLLKLADVKGTDGKTSLLHFVVQEIIRSEGMESNTKTESNPAFNEGTFKKRGLQIVHRLSRELSHVKKAAGMDSHVLYGHVTKLEIGLQKIQSEGDETQEIQGNFYESMRMFVTEAETELKRIKIDGKKALASVKDVIEYFHGDIVKEGVYPLRMFVIVRDFLGILDHVCKEVGQMQDRIMVDSASSFRVPISPPLPR